MKPTTVRYGPRHAQIADLWRPRGDRADLPVVVLIHGGFWKQPYTKRLMRRVARVVLAHGWAAYNIEYRRIGPFGRGGWPETFDDVSDAIDALGDVDGINRRRVVACGHSAGGQLALWAGSSRATGTNNTNNRPGSQPIRLRAAISLAGVVDLSAAARLGLGEGAVEALMGATPDQMPDRYHVGLAGFTVAHGHPRYSCTGWPTQPCRPRSAPPMSNWHGHEAMPRSTCRCPGWDTWR